MNTSVSGVSIQALWQAWKKAQRRSAMISVEKSGGEHYRECSRECVGECSEECSGEHTGGHDGKHDGEHDIKHY